MSITWQLPAKTALSRLSAACWQAALLSCGHWGATAPSTTENHLIRGWWQLSRNCRHVVCSTCWIVFPCLNGWPPTEVAWFFSRLKVGREISSKMKGWKCSFRSRKHRPLLRVLHPNLPTSQLLNKHSTFGLSIRGTKQGLAAFPKRKAETAETRAYSKNPEVPAMVRVREACLKFKIQNYRAKLSRSRCVQ